MLQLVTSGRIRKQFPGTDFDKSKAEHGLHVILWKNGCPVGEEEGEQDSSWGLWVMLFTPNRHASLHRMNNVHFQAVDSVLSEVMQAAQDSQHKVTVHVTPWVESELSVWFAKLARKNCQEIEEIETPMANFPVP